MLRLLLLLPVALVVSSGDVAHAQYYPYPPRYPYPPPYYPPGYYPAPQYRPPPPPPAYMYRGAPPAPYYYGPNNSANCGTPDEPKPCYR